MARQGGGIQLLMAEFLDYRPVARKDAALNVYDRIPAALTVNEDGVVEVPAGDAWQQLKEDEQSGDRYEVPGMRASC